MYYVINIMTGNRAETTKGLCSYNTEQRAEQKAKCLNYIMKCDNWRVIDHL